MKNEKELLKKEVEELEVANLEYMESIAKLVSTDNKNKNTILKLTDRVAQLESSIHHQIFKERVVEDPTIFSELKTGEAIKGRRTASDVAFSSRFMPNVKFKAEGHIEELNSIGIYCSIGTVLVTRHDGKISLLSETGCEKEVSIYEAIPELVPEGMAYDKESDSLILDDFVSLKTEGGVEALVSKHVWKAMRRNKSSDSHQKSKEELVDPSTNFSDTVLPDGFLKLLIEDGKEIVMHQKTFNLLVKQGDKLIKRYL